MDRRDFLSALLMAGIATMARLTAGADTPSGATAAELEQQLKIGLKARRPVEFDFIHRVVLLVQAQQLPIDLVQSTFLWAKKHKPYPYPYFERGLRERAAAKGIDLD